MKNIGKESHGLGVDIRTSYISKEVNSYKDMNKEFNHKSLDEYGGRHGDTYFNMWVTIRDIVYNSNKK